MKTGAHRAAKFCTAPWATCLTSNQPLLTPSGHPGLWDKSGGEVQAIPHTMENVVTGDWGDAGANGEWGNQSEWGAIDSQIHRA